MDSDLTIRQLASKKIEELGRSSFILPAWPLGHIVFVQVVPRLSIDIGDEDRGVLAPCTGTLVVPLCDRGATWVDSAVKLFPGWGCTECGREFVRLFDDFSLPDRGLVFSGCVPDLSLDVFGSKTEDFLDFWSHSYTAERPRGSGFIAFTRGLRPVPGQGGK